jgi:eukaryotic-like serine/threonine-protein kinase
MDNRYRIITKLDSGGMADIFLVRLDAPAEFAKLAVTLAELSQMHEMFRHEACIAARLNHPGIVQTFEAGEDSSGPFIAMEYLEGQPLSRLGRSARKGSPSLSLACQLRVLSDVLLALHYIHELHDNDGSPLRIIHRDVSPHNIFLTYAGATKLIDFGISKAWMPSSDVSDRIIRGKLRYMAPEQAQCLSAQDHRADIYSAGVVLWEALAAKRL